ncbi:tetratricopeptide repeat protein [candidate division KSB3 bacterium]|uniref:Tetratricopeptide repeat protein n=1 Tax=candidate division KSB3 bacterium TaxID=2044937 RepID=A0A9D5JWJ3_9BACT|nr:tetratricopeptide repeat protein [candidate division KSB3 bacterium]MBD3325222.1 tetratricopeptide repeat protein [candidate division KSB3 bacterium]
MKPTEGFIPSFFSSDVCPHATWNPRPNTPGLTRMGGHAAHRRCPDLSNQRTSCPRRQIRADPALHPCRQPSPVSCRYRRLSHPHAPRPQLWICPVERQSGRQPQRSDPDDLLCNLLHSPSTHSAHAAIFALGTPYPRRRLTDHRPGRPLSALLRLSSLSALPGATSRLVVPHDGTPHPQLDHRLIRPHLLPLCPALSARGLSPHALAPQPAADPAGKTPRRPHRLGHHPAAQRRRPLLYQIFRRVALSPGRGAHRRVSLDGVQTPDHQGLPRQSQRRLPDRRTRPPLPDRPVRGQQLWDLHGNNPLWYRYLNWKTALHIIRDHPLFGTGLATFGKMYPQYMQPGANESQYVHNTYLQFGAELGLLGLLLVIGLAGWWMLRSGLTLKQSSTTSPLPQSFWCFLGGLGFLLHNIVDFDFYVFPLGLLGIALLALTLNDLFPAASRSAPAIPAAKFRPLVLVIAATLLLTIYVKDWQFVQAKRQSEHAVAAMQAGHYDDAYPHLQQAIQYRPRVAEYTALTGSLHLHQGQPDAAIQSFQIAIQHEPQTPWFHAGLAEAFLTTHNVSLAYAENRRAAELFPQKPEYRQLSQQIREIFSQKQLPSQP